MAETTKHSIKWFAVGRDMNGEPYRIARTSSMVASGFGWDAACSCGWETHTGGAIQSYIKQQIGDHKWDVNPDGEAAKWDAQHARRMAKFDALLARTREAN